MHALHSSITFLLKYFDMYIMVRSVQRSEVLWFFADLIGIDWKQLGRSGDSKRVVDKALAVLIGAITQVSIL